MPSPKSKISITYALLKAANEQGGYAADTDLDTDAP